MVDKDVVLTIIVVLFILMIAVFIVLFILIYHRRQIRNYKEKQLLQSQHTQALLQTQLEIQEQTLHTVSQEIHDNIGQVLGLVKLNLNNLITQQPDTPKLTDTKDLVAKVINDLRNLTRSLHGGRIADLGLPEALAQELHTLQNTGQFSTQLQTTGKPYRLEPQHEMVLFRMVQEALHNAIKHSGAAHITIILGYEPHQFQLTVTDDGKGFDPTALAAAQKGIGLKSMENRAALIGAVFSINTAVGQGTRLTTTLPRTTEGR
jgi:two-component system, NarL family, sensor kinase